MKLDSKQKDIIEKLIIEFEIPENKIIEILESPFIFIRQTLKEIKLEGTETEEEFHEKTKNFNIPRIGKLYANYYNFKRVNNHHYGRRKPKV